MIAVIVDRLPQWVDRKSAIDSKDHGDNLVAVSEIGRS